MLDKAIVEQVINKYRIRVRIPKKHKLGNVSDAVNTEYLPIASICYQPGYPVSYNKGDVVYVDYEDATELHPVVVGKLYIEKEDDL